MGYGDGVTVVSEDDTFKVRTVSGEVMNVLWTGREIITKAFIDGLDDVYRKSTIHEQYMAW